MRKFVATFHTHLSAMLTYKALGEAGIDARMAPVPRSLSSSCGTCVKYVSADSRLDIMDRDVEAVYEENSSGEYLKVSE